MSTPREQVDRLLIDYYDAVLCGKPDADIRAAILAVADEATFGRCACHDPALTIALAERDGRSVCGYCGRDLGPLPVAPK